MGFLGELLQSITDLFYPKERPRRYDEAKTVPMSAKLLAQALAGEGRRHAAVGFAQSGKLSSSVNEVSLFSLMGGADGHNVLPDFGIFGVSQGVGAMNLAAQASDAAIRAFSASMIHDAILGLLSNESGEEAASLNHAVAAAFRTAVQRVTSELPGTSFSMTAGLLFGEIVILGQLGSASAYIVDHHHIEQITNVQGIGEERSSDYGSNGFKHNQQAGGSRREELSDQVSVYSRPIPRDGYILLCTQGLTDAIPEYDIQRIMLELQEPQSICDGLVNEAHRRKAGVTLSTVALHFPPDF